MTAPKLQRRDDPGPENAELGSEVIDLAHLRRFTLGDEALEQEILGLFIAQLPVTIQALKEARTDRDWLIAAHTLKGSARAVGAWRLARIAELAERSARPSDQPGCELVLKDLAVAAREARERIDALGHRH
jgi:HPt (histidine-containing phosphotransfer) domain-containing protein